MQSEQLSYMALAQALVDVVGEVVELDEKKRQVLMDRFSEMLQPVCKAADEAFLKGFDKGTSYGRANAQRP